MKKLIFILPFFLLMACKKDSTDLTGTWNIDSVQWDGGYENISGHSISFQDNGRYLYDGTDKGTYLSDGKYLYINGETTAYPYNIQRKRLTITHWYYIPKDPATFPNLIINLSKDK